MGDSVDGPMSSELTDAGDVGLITCSFALSGPVTDCLDGVTLGEVVFGEELVPSGLENIL